MGQGVLQKREALRDSVKMRKHETLNNSVIVTMERPLSLADNGQGSCCSWVHWVWGTNLQGKVLFFVSESNYESILLFYQLEDHLLLKPLMGTAHVVPFIKIQHWWKHQDWQCQAKLRSAKPKTARVVTLTGTPEESIMWVRSNLSFGCQEELCVTQNTEGEPVRMWMSSKKTNKTRLWLWHPKDQLSTDF